MLVEAFFLVNLLNKEPSDAAFPTLRHCQEVSVKLTGKWGLLPTEMRRLKQLEDENSKLRKVVADLSLDKEMLQDVIRRKL